MICPHFIEEIWIWIVKILNQFQIKKYLFPPIYKAMKFSTDIFFFYLQASGHRINADFFDKIGLGDMRDRLQDLIKKMRELKIDENEYVCLKYLVLLNPGEMIGVIFWFLLQYFFFFSIYLISLMC